MFATFILMIVILNLLISILSNSFAEIKIIEKVANHYEKTVLLQEIDETIPWFVIHFFESRGKMLKYLFLASCISETKTIIRRSNEDIYKKMQEISNLLEKQYKKTDSPDNKSM